MTLAEFNKKTPVNMAIPRTGDINDPKWNTVDLSKSKNPQQQAKLFTKKMVDPSASVEQISQISAQSAAASHQNNFGDFASVSETANPPK